MDDRKQPGNSLTASHGFTLIELVAVMVFIATLSALAVPRFSLHDATLPAQADQFGRVLRHAQMMAMSQGRSLTVTIRSATAYAITDGSSTTPERDASGEEQQYTLLNQVTLAGTDIEFDSLGRPLNGAALADAAQSWTLNGAGGNTATVSIQPVTGFVTVTP